MIPIYLNASTSTGTTPAPAPPDDRPSDQVPPDRYVTTRDLVDQTARLAMRLPAEIDAIVGVARSGMLPAVQLAALLHVPLYSTGASPLHAPSPIVYVGHGWRMQATLRAPEPPPRVVAIVDDTARFGVSMGKLVPHVAARWPDAKILTAAVYCHPDARRFIDYPGAIYPGYHYLEWNLFNTGLAAYLATDLDGVLCEDCPPEADDDGPAYRAWLESALPIQRPVFAPVPLIVTARLEKYRERTEAWLRRHGLRYKRLVMGPWQSQAERNERWPEKVADYKASVYAGSDARLFVESDPEQAHRIREITARPVLCPQIQRVL